MSPSKRRRLSRADRDLLWVSTFAPSDLADHPLDELLAERHRAVVRLAGAPRAERRGSVPLAMEGLTVLSHSHAAAEALLRSRWFTAREVLAAGAEVRTVARAMGLDPDEVRMGVRQWADAQGMTDAEYAEVLALLAEDGDTR